MILSHFLTYCQDYSNCFSSNSENKREREEESRTSSYLLSFFFFFSLSPFKGTSEPREISLELEEIRIALGCEGVGIERE